MTGPSRLCFYFICLHTAIYRRGWRAGEETEEKEYEDTNHTNGEAEAVNEPLEPCRARGTTWRFTAPKQAPRSR